MASPAKSVWDTESSERLGELERVHTVVRGRGPGRRWYTDQLNRSLFVALVAQFQIYCRNLHSDAVAAYLSPVSAPQHEVLQRLLVQDLQLNRRNPRRGVLGRDFRRLGLDLIGIMNAQSTRVRGDLERLDLLIDFRNAIVHGNELAIQSHIAAGLVATNLKSYKQFKKTTDRLVNTMDSVVSTYLADELRTSPPW